ncbi:MAG: hypothetical protein U0T82_02665 [Bacteroidales bacterium]
MNIKKTFVYFGLLSFAAFLSIKGISQQVDYGYSLWPGKQLAVKFNIEFPNDLIVKYKMLSLKGSEPDAPSFRFSSNTSDDTKNYSALGIVVFESIEKAQLNLFYYLNELSSPISPPRVTTGIYVVGDVTFAQEIDGKLYLTFTKNNVFVSINAPNDAAIEIAKRIEENIERASIWKINSEKPSFISILDY